MQNPKPDISQIRKHGIRAPSRRSLKSDLFHRCCLRLYSPDSTALAGIFSPSPAVAATQAIILCSPTAPALLLLRPAACSDLERCYSSSPIDARSSCCSASLHSLSSFPCCPSSCCPAFIFPAAASDRSILFRCLIILLVWSCNYYIPLTHVIRGESCEGSMMEKGQNHPKNTDKRVKIEEHMETAGDDIISALPDYVLHEILSRLPSTKYAIRTGTFSKRWTHLWTWVPTLIFRISYNPYGCQQNPNIIRDFVLSVSKTITQCHQLKKLKVNTFYDMQFEVQYNNWIRHAINCNVEELDLDLDYNYPGRGADKQLDQSNFFINSCFTDLRLRGLTLNPSGAINWKNLRSLCISSQNLNEELIVNILSGSPLLEKLCLKYDEMTVESDVESEDEFEDLYTSQWPELKHLKKFKVSAVCHNLFASQVKSWIHYVIKCNVKNICISLWLDDRSEYELPIDEIIFTSSCVTDLRLDRCTVNPVGAISWKNLTSLHLSDCCLNEVMIENILSGSPVLETLVLDGCFGYTRLDITSNSVKNLVLSGRLDSYSNSEPKDAIEINAPNILSLTIQHQIIMRKVLLVNVSSLVKANLNYHFRDICFHDKTMPMEVEEMLKNHMMNIGHVKELKIGNSCYKALSCLRDKGFVFPSNVKFPDQLKG